jgi:alcohol dehydrogenase
MHREQGTKRVLTMLQPKRLVFGCGCLAEAIAYFVQLRPAHLRILTSGSLVGTATSIASELRKSGLEVSIDDEITSEPTIQVFKAATQRARDAGATCILGLGGGSVMDVAKLVAAFVRSNQKLEDAFGIGLLRSRECHLVCMPATSGTGSEVSPNALLLDEQARLKRAVISSYLVPDAAFIDPELTKTIPPAITASTGLDALAHCIEAYTNKFSHPMIDLYALEGISLAGRFLLRAVRCSDDMEAREGMALASVYGGLCLGPVNTAGVHALAYPLGAEYHIPHGVSVALLLPHVFRFNAEAAPTKHADAGRALGISAHSTTDMETADAAATALGRLIEDSGLNPNLEGYGVPFSAIPSMAASAMKVERLLRNNPRLITEEDCIQIYKNSFQQDVVSERLLKADARY